MPNLLDQVNEIIRHEWKLHWIIAFSNFYNFELLRITINELLTVRIQLKTLLVYHGKSCMYAMLFHFLGQMSQKS